MCVLECGFPYCSVRNGNMASSTLGSRGVVACISKYIGRPRSVTPFISNSGSSIPFPIIAADDADDANDALVADVAHRRLTPQGASPHARDDAVTATFDTDTDTAAAAEAEAAAAVGALAALHPTLHPRRPHVSNPLRILAVAFSGEDDSLGSSLEVLRESSRNFWKLLNASIPRFYAYCTTRILFSFYDWF
jgi:hypothetical protein